MKTGKEIGLLPIKLKNKYGSKEIDNLQKEINELLYFFYFKYVNKTAKNYLLQMLIQFGIDLKNIDQPLAKKSSSKKDELIEILRKYYTTLKAYYPDEDIELEQKMSKMVVSQYLKAKKEGFPFKDYLEWLYNIKLFASLYTVTDSLKSVQKEIIKNFEI